MSWLTPPVIIAIIALATGGLAGSVFTWWIKREPNAKVIYSITTISSGAAHEVKSLIPNLTMKIGERNIPALYTHIIILRVVGGYSDSGPLGIELDDDVEVFGASFLRSSILRSITETRVKNGFTCTLSPLDEGAAFRIVLATDSERPPGISTVGKQMRLISEAEISRIQRLSNLASWIQTAAVIGGMILAFYELLRHLFQ